MLGPHVVRFPQGDRSPALGQGEDCLGCIGVDVHLEDIADLSHDD